MLSDTNNNFIVLNESMVDILDGYNIVYKLMVTKNLGMEENTT